MGKFLICGLDCTPSGKYCNGYCRGQSPTPPESPPGYEVINARRMAMKSLYDAETAFFVYLNTATVPEEVTHAEDVYEKIRHLPRYHPKDEGTQ